MKAKEEIIITQIETLDQFIAQNHSLENCTLQNVDLSEHPINWESIKIENTTFLGCIFPNEEVELHLRRIGGIIYPLIEGLPYNPYRSALYKWQELEQIMFNGETKDYQIYQHFSATKHHPNINEALSQRIHDHAIDDALRALLDIDADGNIQKKCVGIMGGHSTKRNDPFYKKTAIAAKLLTEAGFFVLSGGGPGIMEAANLGAYFAGKEVNDLNKALDILIQAPHYSEEGFTQQAKNVLDLYPSGAESVAIPTWFYGHEPSNLFGSHIAKYFSNAIREDVLLAIALYGIVFSPGSAGTTQEIFMDAAQNHYGSYGYYSPMVFLGKERYKLDTDIYNLIQQLSTGRIYNRLLHLSDEPESVVEFIKNNPPIKLVV